MINRMLQDAFQGKTTPEREPFVRGFTGHSRSRDEERGPRRRLVLQVPPEPAMPGAEVVANDVEVFVTFDLGDTTLTDMRAHAVGRFLEVEVAGARPLRRVVELPCDVEPTVRWTVHNGVLDLVLPRARRGFPNP